MDALDHHQEEQEEAVDSLGHQQEREEVEHSDHHKEEQEALESLALGERNQVAHSQEEALMVVVAHLAEEGQDHLVEATDLVEDKDWF